MLKNQILKSFLTVLTGIVLFFLLGRVYYSFTDGFSPSEIRSEISSNVQIETKPLSHEEKIEIEKILNQPFYYLGKGIQSYVFVSGDDQYVIKFLKYKHLSVNPFLSLFSFIPSIDVYQKERKQNKIAKLKEILTSWKMAYEDLKEETAVVYVHLNKNDPFHEKLVIYDKMGRKFEIQIDDLEFLIQKKAKPLADFFKEEMKKNDIQNANLLIDALLQKILSLYERGYGDSDHTLVQNTAVLNGKPLFIDVGGFQKSENYKEKNFQDQEIFNKTYRFRLWLKKRYPELQSHLEFRLKEHLGPKMEELIPVVEHISHEI